MKNRERLLTLIDLTAQTFSIPGTAKEEMLALLKESSIQSSDYGALRSYIFDKAYSFCNGNDLSKVLAWLEATLKLLERGREPSAAKKPEVYFSPGAACRDRIHKALFEARCSVDICVFTISDNFISEAILSAEKRGIDIRIITDDDKCYDEGSDIHRLSKNNIAIRTDNSPALMHNKFVVIDNILTITGSYNWTRTAAMENGENIIVLYDAIVANTYLETFEKLWKTSVTLRKNRY
ncbi:MAG TPA: phospholipase D-like domain-containing protein [Bacteroidales bacterium]|nr:phospholipase D-like domain-containing protein [Bacteroidales bacterium]